MPSLSQLSQYLDDLYQPQDFEDYIESGLLIEANSQISKGGTAVSFTLETVKKAVESKLDFLVVHHAHGFWNNASRRISGGFGEKVSLCLSNGINLFGYHLPMDAQIEIGNNMGILKALELEKKQEFIKAGRRSIAYVGQLKEAISYAKFLEKVHLAIGPSNFDFKVGADFIKSVAVCSGGAASSIREAKQTGADLYLTGEAKEDTYNFCQDEKFNFIAAGHYQTEVFGPKLLAGKLAGDFKIPVEFIHDKNPV